MLVMLPGWWEDWAFAFREQPMLTILDSGLMAVVGAVLLHNLAKSLERYKSRVAFAEETERQRVAALRGLDRALFDLRAALDDVAHSVQISSTRSRHEAPRSERAELLRTLEQRSRRGLSIPRGAVQILSSSSFGIDGETDESFGFKFDSEAKVILNFHPTRRAAARVRRAIRDVGSLMPGEPLGGAGTGGITQLAASFKTAVQALRGASEKSDVDATRDRLGSMCSDLQVRVRGSLSLQPQEGWLARLKRRLIPSHAPSPSR